MSIDADDFTRGQRAPPNRELVHEHIDGGHTPSIRVASSAVLTKVDRIKTGVGVGASNRVGRVGGQVGGIFQNTVDIDASNTAPLKDDSNVMPLMVEHLASVSAAVAPGVNVIAKVPFHRATLGSQHPTRVTTAVPVLVADKRLIVILAELLGAKANREIVRGKH